MRGRKRRVPGPGGNSVGATEVTKRPPMRRIVLAFLVVGLLATGAWAQTRFPDVPADHEHAAAIEYAAEKGWFAGYDDGTFRPDRTLSANQATTVFGRAFPDGVTRAEFANILYIADGNLPAAPTTTSATQEPTAQDCTDAICLVDHYWFGSGYDNSVDNYAVKFRVNQSCSSLYVEVQLLDSNDRRIGERGNELLSNPSIGREFTVEVRYINDWDSFVSFEWEYTCY